MFFNPCTNSYRSKWVKRFIYLAVYLTILASQTSMHILSHGRFTYGPQNLWQGGPNLNCLMAHRFAYFGLLSVSFLLNIMWFFDTSIADIKVWYFYLELISILTSCDKICIHKNASASTSIIILLKFCCGRVYFIQNSGKLFWPKFE